MLRYYRVQTNSLHRLLQEWERCGMYGLTNLFLKFYFSNVEHERFEHFFVSPVKISFPHVTVPVPCSLPSQKSYYFTWRLDIKTINWLDWGLFCKLRLPKTSSFKCNHYTWSPITRWGALISSRLCGTSALGMVIWFLRFVYTECKVWSKFFHYVL